MKKRPSVIQCKARGRVVHHKAAKGCPRYDHCSAPICPLDPEWRERTMLNDDPTCFYLTEAVKGGAKALFEGRGRGDMYEAMVTAAPEMSSRWGRINRSLERSRTTGSRMSREAP